MKQRIVLASLLKPVNDTRMYEKFALPLLEAGFNDIHVMGCAVETQPPPQGISFYTIFKGNRLSISRLGANFKYLQLLLKLKPKLIIVNSPDLLIVTSVHRIIFGTKILYDVQENYFANITATPVYPRWLRYPLGYFVRLMERLVAPAFNHFILAEACYENELPFIGKRYTVIENKFLAPPNWQTPPPRFPTKGNIKLLYSGTIAEHYGIWETLALAKKLYKVDNSLTLTIIGYCAQESLWKKLEKEIATMPFVKLIGGNKLVPHALILNEISKANLGLLTYQINDSSKNRIPTKLFEYTANNLTLLITNHQPWLELLNRNSMPYLVISNSLAENLLTTTNKPTLFTNFSFSKYKSSTITILLKSLLNS